MLSPRRCRSRKPVVHPLTRSCWNGTVKLGYKIRHVPATLPDMLKTEAVLEWEYEAFLGRTPDQAIRAMKDRMNWFRAGGSDYEIAVPVHELQAFAAGA